MKTIRRRLGWKLFFSYLVVILVGVVSLAIVAEWHAPTALARHMANMQAVMGDDADEMTVDLLENFQTAVTEVLVVSAIIAVFSAVVVSTFVTRRVVRPIQVMTAASQRIADGRYNERVQVAGGDELAKLSISFNRMAHQLEQTEQRRRQLIGDVAHELRTPLSNIKSVMEGLQDGVLPAEPEIFANVEQEVNRLQRLVRDLEDLSKAEAGQIPLEKEMMSPADLVKTAVARLHPQFDDKGVSLIFDSSSDLPAIDIDPARMGQVLLNLLGNALQYTPSGGCVTVQCAVTGKQELAESCPLDSETCLQITVHDTGVGLTTKAQRHVFERFYRVDKSRSRAGGGSGIGLTISKHIVEAHNGRLTVTSPGPDKGSMFTVTLPLPGVQYPTP